MTRAHPDAPEYVHPVSHPDVLSVSFCANVSSFSVHAPKATHRSARRSTGLRQRRSLVRFITSVGWCQWCKHHDCHIAVARSAAAQVDNEFSAEMVDVFINVANGNAPRRSGHVVLAQMKTNHVVDRAGAVLEMTKINNKSCSRVCVCQFVTLSNRTPYICMSSQTTFNCVARRNWAV